MNKEFKHYNQFVINVYEYFYRKVTLDDAYIYKETASDAHSIENFLKNFIFKDASKDFHYIINFMEYSFNYWVKRINNSNKYRYGHKSITLSWIIGKESIKRHIEISGKFQIKRYRLRNFINSKIGVKPTEEFKEFLNVDLTKIDKFVKIYEHEEKLKAKHHNTDNGLRFCLSTTTLYNHKSEYCAFCNFMEDCKILLKENFNSLYRKRGY